MKKIWEQLTSENWCKCAYTRYTDKGQAVAHCAAGWIGRVYPNEPTVYRRVMDELGLHGQIMSTWNDHHSRTFEEVFAVFRKLDL